MPETGITRPSIVFYYLPSLHLKRNAHFRFLVEDKHFVRFKREGNNRVGLVDFRICVYDSANGGFFAMLVCCDDAKVASHNFHVLQVAVERTIFVVDKSFGTNADVNFLTGQIVLVCFGRFN